jgi:hypothetical protein
MTISSITVISTGWDTLEHGAEVYGYGDWRSFLRPVQDGRVLGARQEAGRWRSHPEGLVGPIPDIPHRCIVPAGTKEVICEACSGEVSGLIVLCGVNLKVKFPYIDLRSEPSSGLMVRIVPLSKVQEG